MRQIILISLIILVGCTNTYRSIDTSRLKEWRANSSLHLASFKTLPAEDNGLLLAKLVEVYSLNSYLPTHDSIIFDKVVLNDKSQRKIYVFHIVGISDIKAAFEIDDDNNLVDNFLISSF